MAKIPDGQIGTKQGKHSDALAKQGLCHCGGCTNKLLGQPKPVVVIFKAPRER